jgi:hypothetical protein
MSPLADANVIYISNASDPGDFFSETLQVKYLTREIFACYNKKKKKIFYFKKKLIIKKSIKKIKK